MVHLEQRWSPRSLSLRAERPYVEGCPIELLLSQARPFRDIRESVSRAVVEADQGTALQAMGVLPELFLVTRDREEQLALLQALEVAAIDQRVRVAAEAAYTATFLLAHQAVAEHDRRRLEVVRSSLVNDPCALIRRKLEVGAAVGINHAKKHGGVYVG